MGLHLQDVFLLHYPKTPPTRRVTSYIIIYIKYLTIQLRLPPVLSVLGTINLNLLVLLVLPDWPLPYQDISSNDVYFDHSQCDINYDNLYYISSKVLQWVVFNMLLLVVIDYILVIILWNRYTKTSSWLSCII